MKERPPLPTKRSPSQWPGTARSATSGGRSEIGTMPGIRPRSSGPAERERRLLRPERRLPASWPAQLAARLDVERLVDRLVADPHLRIVGVLTSQSGRYLLRRPAAPKPGLDRGEQPWAAGELAGLRSRQPFQGVALGGQCAVAAPTADALDLTADRRRRPTELAG